MALTNEQLILLDALVYYQEFSDNYVPKINPSTGELEYLTVGEFIQDILNSRDPSHDSYNPDKYYTCFDGNIESNGKTLYDSDLGRDDILRLVKADSVLCGLEIVYPDHSFNDPLLDTNGNPLLDEHGNVLTKHTTTSSVCLINPGTKEVYVIFGGNYIEGTYNYNDTEMETWSQNLSGAFLVETAEQKRALDFYKEAIVAARDALGLTNGEDLDITVSGHSAAGNHAQREPLNSAFYSEMLT